MGLQISALTFHLGCIQHAFKHNSISCQTDDGVQGNAIAARDRATRVWTDDDGIFQLSNYLTLQFAHYDNMSPSLKAAFYHLVIDHQVVHRLPVSVTSRAIVTKEVIDEGFEY